MKDENPTAEELAAWIARSGLPAEKFLIPPACFYQEKNLKSVLPEFPRRKKISLLAQDGMLVKRPLLIGTGFVLVGFRQEQWEEKLLK